MQMLAGHAGWDPVGQGTLTLYDGEFRGGRVDDEDPVGFGVTLARYE